MLIRSQDKMSVFNLDSFDRFIIKDDYSQVYICAKKTLADGKSRGYTLGAYSSKANALYVMDRLVETYKDYYYTQGGALATANFYVQPFGLNYPKFYQMPEDSVITEIIKKGKVK